ncbi:Na+/H+ antiporter subunit E [uncultured Brevundimonas sp.]|uniref:Na+/H+ antiporter subunit E n=1 Tax=uncultured Brevundimonas sp. TaxID=213418 RepID=UPI00260E8F33|nr:Na+/H+ antiporter subunit E [uncultured Brevundimonas sp.]
MRKLFARILPHPILSVALFIVWMLVSSPAGRGHFTLALIIALLVPQSMRVLEPSTVKVRKPLRVLRLLVNWTLDMLQSNWDVIRLILGHRKGQRQSGFVQIPLQCNNRYALACLAIIISSTPGTAWVQYNRYSRVLLLHVLDLKPGDDWSRIIHDRYESHLLEIFP